MKIVNVCVSGCTGSGKTGIVRIIEDALMKRGIEMKFTFDTEQSLDERLNHKNLFSLEEVSSVISERVIVQIQERQTPRIKAM